MDDLTKDAKFLLSSMYNEYLKRRKSGSLKKDAVSFGNLEEVHELLMKDWPVDDVRFTLNELGRHEFVNSKPASNTLFRITLTTKAIATLEVTFNDRVNDVLSFMAKVKDSIPFF